MSTKRPESVTGDPTQPTEIPTAVMEHELFDDDSGTAVDDKTIDMTGEGSGDVVTPALKKFRRPTKSEIVDAVDQVNTESIDVALVHEEQVSHRDTEDQEIQEDV